MYWILEMAVVERWRDLGTRGAAARAVAPPPSPAEEPRWLLPALAPPHAGSSPRSAPGARWLLGARRGGELGGRTPVCFSLASEERDAEKGGNECLNTKINFENKGLILELMF